jgi:hypothetical protein
MATPSVEGCIAKKLQYIFAPNAGYDKLIHPAGSPTGGSSISGKEDILNV